MQATKGNYATTQTQMREQALFLSFPLPDYESACGLRDYTPTNSPKKAKTSSSAPVMKHSYEVIAFNAANKKVLIDTTDFWGVQLARFVE